MYYSQLDYYYRNREKILKKNREKAQELKKYNAKFNVRPRKTKTKTINNLIIKEGKFILSFE